MLLLEDEDDWIAAMATVVCELHHAFDYFHWTGFYRVVSEQELVIGPYHRIREDMVASASPSIAEYAEQP